MIEIKKWKFEESYPFKGWDFSHLNNRWENEKLSWNYKEIIKKYLNSKMNLLDMDTGDGKFLLSLNHPYNKTFATEGYLPNYNLCKKTLSPLGITIKFINKNNLLDYKKDKFDIIINKHGAFSIDEIYRTLKPNGIFITQQVGGKNNYDLSTRIIKNFKPKFLNNTLNNIKTELQIKGFEIIKSKEEYPKIKFFDTGAFIFFAKIIEWEFPNFSVDNNLNDLIKIDNEIKEIGYLEGTEHRYIIVAKKSK